MAITVTEKIDSRKLTTGPDASVELIYTIRGTADDLAAKAALEAAAPTTYDNLKRKNCSVEPVHVDTRYPDACIWQGVAKYERPEKRPPTGAILLSFDTTGGTTHITQSISTVNKYAPPGKTAPDFQGAIGVTHDSVEGVDITTPTFKFSVTLYVASAKVTPTYIGKLFSLTGKVNNSDTTVWGLGNFNAGELLFLGAQGSQRAGGEDWEIQFSFMGSPNRTGITVGDIANIAKKGWEYMWVRYADAEDGDAKTVVKRPVAVYIEKVYETGNFDDLDPPV